jgi:signal transduction histidine kinase
VWADPARVQQVLTNLVSNAVRYTPDGGTVTVTLRLLPGARHPATPPMVRLDVADSGPGLAPAEVARVFERFWRADAARARVTGGAGLGLAIARQLVAAQGGGIGVDSAPGAGSRFWFTLPLAPAAARVAAAPATVPL